MSSEKGNLRKNPLNVLRNDYSALMARAAAGVIGGKYFEDGRFQHEDATSRVAIRLQR